MTTFNYTGGALSNLTGNTPGANVSNLVTLLNDLKTFINGANLDATNLANGGVTAAKIEAQQVWQTIAVTGFTAATLSYYKDSLGNVHFRGDALTSASPGAGSTLCTLPAGYRPVGTQFFAIQSTTTAAAGSSTPLSVSAAGVVSNVLALGVNTWTFGAVHFRAEN